MKTTQNTKAKRKNKYIYYKVLQGDCGYGWDDLCSYDTADPDYLKELKSDLIAYRENERGTAFRVIKRRVLA